MEHIKPGKTVLGLRPGWGFDVLWFVLALVLIHVLLGLLPVKLDLLLRAGNTKAVLSITVKIFLIKFGREIQLGAIVQNAVDHMLKRWEAKGEPVKVPLQKTIRQLPHASIWQAVEKPLRRLGRNATCQHLAFDAEVGGRDAMESALLTGFGYSVAGAGLGLLSSVVKVIPDAPAISVSPNYEQPSLGVRLHCIFACRFGEARLAGVWMLLRLLGDREIRTWAVHSWRRKGVEGDVGASDSGSDENGHGKP